MADDLPSERLFLGKFRPVLDPKHRITVPKVWREGDKSEQFFLTPSVDGSHLDVLPPAEFRKAYNRLEADTTLAPADRRTFQRAYFSEVVPCDTDTQGRIVVPEEFCRTAELQGELLLLGAYSIFEIWSPARWEAVRQREIDTANRVGAAQGR